MGKMLEKVGKWLNGRSEMLPDGSELPDPRPVELPIGFERPESIQETIRRLVLDPSIRDELSGRDVETFEDADDFEIEDDVPQSPHEDQFDPQHLLAREQEINAGAVKPLSADEIKAAQDAIASFRAKKVAPPVAAPEKTPPAA